MSREVFILPRNWRDSEPFYTISTEAIGLHFVSWSRASTFPKYRGHISLAADYMSISHHTKQRARRLRAELLAAGLRRPCAGDGYHPELCGPDCQVIVDFQPTRTDRGPNVDYLRAMARRVLPTDGFSCVECDAQEDLTVDHIVPVSRGGGNDPSNLRILCRPCNSRKGARL